MENSVLCSNEKINSTEFNFKHQGPFQSFENLIFFESASFLMRFVNIPPTFYRRKCCLKFDGKVSKKSCSSNIEIKN